MKLVISKEKIIHRFLVDYSLDSFRKRISCILIPVFSLLLLSACGGGERSPAAESGTNISKSETDTIVTLSWNINPENIDGYYIFHGSSGQTATSQITDTADLTDFNKSSPTISYDAVKDLGMKSGQQICFRVKAYNQNGSSGYSEAVCSIL